MNEECFLVPFEYQQPWVLKEVGRVIGFGVYKLEQRGINWNNPNVDKWVSSSP